MQHQDAGSTAKNPATADACEHQAEALADIESYSLGDGTSLAAIELQADQLLNYIRKLRSSTDRARAAVLHQSLSSQPGEHACQAEVDGLRSQLQESFAFVERCRRELDSRENISKGQVTVLEKQLREREIQFKERESEIKHLRVEAEESNQQAESRVQERIDPLIQEIASLKTELPQRDEIIRANSSALRKVELDCRATVSEIEQRLRDMDVNLHSLEAQLQEKVAVIQATAGKEAGVGKLIKQLSTECQNLNVELQEKTRLLNETHSEKSQPGAEANVWYRIVGRLPEESV